MTLFDSPAFEAHEGVHAFHDEKSGLQAIIAVHSTARGPAAGGVRMWDYETSEAALAGRWTALGVAGVEEMVTEEAAERGPAAAEVFVGLR